MDIIVKSMELELAYLHTFTNQIITSWGALFYNEQQPDYYDANHAQIQTPPENSKQVIREVVDF